MSTPINPLEVVEVHVERQMAGDYTFELVSLGGHSVARRLMYANPSVIGQAVREALGQLARFYASQAKG